MPTESTTVASTSIKPSHQPGCSVSLPEPAATQTVALWQVHPRDNVLIALRTIAQGEMLPEPYQHLTALDEIPAGHKIAIADLAQGAEVRKYGFAIGATTQAVKAGSHLHSHNTATNLSGELAYSYPRPRTIKSFDEDGRVLLCSSFSKTLAPGLRIGWVAPGRYLERVLHMKYISTGSTAPQPQIAIAEFLKAGHFEPHLRRMRTQYQRNRDMMIDWVSRYFPAGTRASRPQGSFMLWVELPDGFDTLKLNRALHDEGVQIAVGSIFSASGKYRNCLRMNYAAKPTPQIEEAVRKVGAAAIKLLAENDSFTD